MRKWFPARFSVKYFALVVILLAAVAFTASVLITMSYQKAIVRYLNSYLKDHLTTRLSMDENIRFRFLKGFPNTTIELKNVLLMSGSEFSRKDFRAGYCDTLLFAPSVYLRFNPFKMVRKEFELKKIQISGGVIRILFDKNNHDNLNIWKSGESGSPGYKIGLRNIIVSDTRLLIESLRNNLKIDGSAVRSNFRGDLSSGVLSGETKGHFRIKQLSYEKKNIVVHSNLQLALDIIYSTNRFRITGGTIQLNKALASISGEYIAGRNNNIDLKLYFQKFGLDELMSVLPLRPETGNYSFNGGGSMQLTINGPLSGADRLTISSSFELNGCEARNNITRSTMSGITLKGNISGTSRENFHLKVNTFNARIGKGNIIGNFEIKSLNKLIFETELNSVIDLKEISAFAGLQDSIELSGIMNSKIHAGGSLKGISSNPVTGIAGSVKDGIFVFTNAHIRKKGLQINNITGKATWSDEIKLDSLSLDFNHSHLLVTGSLSNLNPWLAGKGVLKPELSILCDIFDLYRYIKKEESPQSSARKSTTLFPANIYLKADVKLKKFVAGKFEASNLSANISAIEDSMLVDNIVFGFPDGSIAGKAVFKAESGKQYSLTCKARPEKINIRQLFYVFNNFTQNFIQDKNLKGQLGGNLSFYGRWDSTFSIIPSTVKAIGDIVVTNGELIQFEPMLKLSKYIDVDELRHIKFRTLKNSIYISDRQVSIPEMNINSSAFNISVSGQHSFDNNFDYRVRVLLSEVLFNNARKKKRELNEFLVEETQADQTTIPLIIAGTPKEFDVKFDRKKAFSLSRNRDIAKPTKPNSDSFKVEWEEPPAATVEKPAEIPPSTGVVIEWDE